MIARACHIQSDDTETDILHRPYTKPTRTLHKPYINPTQQPAIFRTPVRFVCRVSSGILKTEFRTNTNQTMHNTEIIVGHVPMAYAVALLVVFMLERLLHSVVWLIVSVARFPVLSGPESMVNVSQNVLTGFLNMSLDMLRLSVSSISGLAQWAIYYIPMALIFIFAVWVLSLVSSTQAGLVRDFLLMWNGGTSVTLRGILIVPLQLLNFVFEVMVPFWNVVIYFWKGVTSDVIIPMLKLNIDPIMKGISSGAAVVQALSESAVSFGSSLTACNDESCLSVGSRVFDFISPMVHVRMLVSYALIFSRDTCGLARPVLDIIAYPFLDANFAQSLHAGLNSVIFALVHLPMITIARCSQAGNDADARVRSISCTPDFAPVFNFATASVRYAGVLADNWLDVTWITIRSVFGDVYDGCAPSPVTLRYEATQTLFGGNETRLVGLGVTSYALTDGNSVQYVFYRGKTDPVSQLRYPIFLLIYAHTCKHPVIQLRYLIFLLIYAHTCKHPVNQLRYFILSLIYAHTCKIANLLHAM
jgi:hypothetical protein